MDHCKRTHAFDVTCHCEGARKDLRKCRWEVTSLATAQEPRPSALLQKNWPKKLAETFVKKNALEPALECGASCLPLLSGSDPLGFWSTRVLIHSGF